VSKNDMAPGGDNLKKTAAAAESKSTWTPAMIAEHKLMMNGVPEGKAPSAASGPDSDTHWKSRQAYRKAFEEHVGHFLSGNLKHPDTGETINHREDALTHAHVAGLKAVQAMKKTGLKFSVYADGH
jgi:hypothetical protein